jgi:hypothetical protein
MSARSTVGGQRINAIRVSIDLAKISRTDVSVGGFQLN